MYHLTLSLLCMMFRFEMLIMGYNRKLEIPTTRRKHGLEIPITGCNRRSEMSIMGYKYGSFLRSLAIRITVVPQ